MIAHAIATKIAKLPGLAGVSFPEVLAVTEHALHEFWTHLDEDASLNHLPLSDLGQCEACSLIGETADYGEVRLCSDCRRVEARAENGGTK